MTEYIPRTLFSTLTSFLRPNKVLVLIGARRIGKTVLINKLLEQTLEPFLKLNGEDQVTVDLLSRRTVAHYQQLLGDKRLLVIDEAQKVPDIGLCLKLMVDHIEGLRVLITGSSAFDMTNQVGEPLTGRKYTFHLFALSEAELRPLESVTEHPDKLRHRLVFGNYPELQFMPSDAERTVYLNEMVQSYLLRDVLAFDTVRNSDKILSLLRLVAFQIGHEISYNELGKQLGMSKNTVERYLDLLSKVFVVFRLGGFSRNLRKEIAKSDRWFFYDNGLRNALISNLKPIELRSDVGQLWENYLISERLKQHSYQQTLHSSYFWRTYDRQEIDLIEERGGALFGYEMKWDPDKNPKIPSAFANAYPEAHFQVIHRENYWQWLTEAPA